MKNDDIEKTQEQIHALYDETYHKMKQATDPDEKQMLQKRLRRIEKSSQTFMRKNKEFFKKKRADIFNTLVSSGIIGV